MNDDKQYFLKALGMNIKKLREEKGWSLEELANKCGYTSDNSRSSMQKIESGKNDVPASKLKMIAFALGVPPSTLMNCSEQVEQIKACELIEKCYGSNAYELVELFIKLNSSGKEKLLERANELIELGYGEKGKLEKMA